MSSMKTILALALLVHSSRCDDPPTGVSLDELMAVNEKSPWLVLITATSYSSSELFRGVSYGSLVKPKTVLTSAGKLFGIDAKELQVLANCKFSSYNLDCDVRDVKDFRQRADLHENEVKDTDWYMLRLKSAFDASPKISPISLLLSWQNVIWSDCLIYRWDITTATYDLNGEGENVRQSGVIHREFPVTVGNTSAVGMTEEGQEQLKEQQDCVLVNCFGVTGREIIKREIHFLGSPIVCPLDESQGDSGLVQVGFTTVYYQINYDGMQNGDDDATVVPKNEHFVPFLH